MWREIPHFCSLWASVNPSPPSEPCGGSPAHGSPVGGFLIGIGTLTHELH